jgi:23S rRNA pseudouridine1911/1915/1917 synthase
MIVKADRGDAGRRLDLVLRRHLAGVGVATRTQIQGWIARGQVSINGAAVRRVSTRAAAGDVISVAGPSVGTTAPMAAEQLPIRILLEDDHLLILDKPAGIVVHPTHAHVQGTVMNALLWHGREWPSDRRPSIVGRLDKLTSGLVVVAKTARLHASLQRAMASPACEKDYLALVYGRVRPERGRIDLRLMRDPANRQRVVASDVEGTPSLTHFERLAHVRAPRAGLSLLRCRLATGRTHQIRVHLAARGWPITGDPLYGEPRWTRIADLELASVIAAFPRQALHAWRLVVRHPATGERLEITAPVPDDLRGLLSAAGLPEP